MKHSRNLIKILTLFLIYDVSFAQTSINELAGNISGNLNQASVDGELNNIYENILKNPETLNFVLKESFHKIKNQNLLKGLDLKFKTFQVDKNSYLGLSYSYDRSIKSNYFNTNGTNSSGLNLSFATEGNISLQRAYNPNDFLKSNVAFAYFNSSGGAVEMTDEVSDSLTGIQMALSELNKDEINNSQLWKDYLAFVSNYMTTQVYFEFSLTGSLESNQDFTSKQYTFGAQLGFDLKAWNRNSSAAQLNVFDWPFAVLRWLAGSEDNIYPRGSAIPTIMIELDYVDPKNDTERRKLNEISQYARLGSEVSFKTFIGKVGEKDLFFSANLRYYKEINPPVTVQKANLDEALYFTAALTHYDGFFFSYTAGKLPLDKKRDEIYSLGFNYKF